MLLLVVSGIITVILAIVAEKFYFSDYEYSYRTRKFNKILQEKEGIMDYCLESMKPLMAEEDHHGTFPENSIFSVAEKNKITILEFLDNKLVAWSDNDFDVPAFYDDSLYRKGFVFLQNGWFLPRTIESGNEKILGLLRIRTDYNLVNDIIQSGFEKEYSVPENVGFSLTESSSEFRIYNKSGDFLFSLLFPDIKKATGFIIIPVVLWSLAFLFSLLICLCFIRTLVRKNMSIPAVGMALVFCVLVYLVIVLFGVPPVLSLTELFSPHKFSMNSFVPSLGHLLIFGVLSTFFAGVFFRFFPVSELKSTDSWKEYLPVSLFFITIALLISYYHFLFRELLLTSNINFLPYKVLELDIYSITGFLSVFLLMLLPVLFLLKILRELKLCSNAFIYSALIPGILMIVVMNWKYPEEIVTISLFYLILTTAVRITALRNTGNFNLTVIYAFISGLYFLYFIVTLSEEKITENNKIQAVSLSTENDPKAENMLLDLWPVISADSLLRDMMLDENFNKSSDDVGRISDYLRDTYFGGYWANFDFNLILCRNDDPLQVGPGNEVFPVCFNFFDERIKRDGQKLTGTEFYFIDNQRGRSFYLGRIMYRSGNYVHGLFIELYGDVNVFQPGYSALLLDENYHGYANLRDYSFAKYINGELVLHTGEFPYDKSDEKYVVKSPDYRIFVSGGFRHVLYKNGNATVLISRPVTNIGDIIISFAYIFAFLLLLSNITMMIIRRPVLRTGGMFNFRQKLQFSFIAILMLSFILIGIVVAYLTIDQYKNRHYENVREKLNSVYLELDSRLSSEKHLDQDWRNNAYPSLNDLLISLSNIFNTDINLYSITGQLIATSRPEIFYRDLTSTRINNTAYINLRDLTMSEYYQKEKIGRLEYYSAYMPFFNTDDKVLAYLNLPYFRIQSVLATEISNLIVAVINFALILILIIIGLAVFISGRLTAPLTMLGDGLASVELGKKTEHLNYRGEDEIGELVRQYNRMVDELEDSATKLANSEREYAWREMAKQIAHEIKNPLTPMKLNVQQLLKSWKDNAANFGEKLEIFARNQIEYIDNLSSIASAFSSFAKMPGAKPADVNLIDQIKVTLELFRDVEGISFRVNWPSEKKVVVFADKEHLNGIFSNLIKNGIQSIPPDRQGVIIVDVSVVKDKAIVSVTDNGTGIPPELQGKMFTPNFTTKSSGTGLGLSIVRKYAETAGGRVWFKSENDKGTAFFVELPLKYTVE